MSSAILYLAIVVIWLFLLVPRWLRKSHSGSASPAAPVSEEPSADDSVEEGLTDAPMSGYAASLPGFLRSVGIISFRRDDEDLADDDDDADTGPIPRVTLPPSGPEAPEDSEGGYRSPSGTAPAPVADSAPGRPTHPALPRTKILQARRRLMTTLVTLVIAALSCTLLGLTSGWVLIPPVGMLGMYLLLLREAALADAENARRRAELAHAAQRRAKARATRAAQRSAEIIDISARLNDQLFDQYAEDTVRAVGD